MAEDWIAARERRKVWMEAQYHKYPELLKYYKDRDDDGMLRALTHGPEVPESWLPALGNLFEQISGMEGLRIVQIKEKFDDLRVYYEYAGHPFETNGWVTATDLIDLRIRECKQQVLSQLEKEEEENGD